MPAVVILSRPCGGDCPRALGSAPGHLARDDLAGSPSRALFHSDPRGGSSKPRAERAGQAVARFEARSAPLLPALRACGSSRRLDDRQAEPRPERRRCPRCGGRGLIYWHPYWDNGCDPCPRCDGSGYLEDA